MSLYYDSGVLVKLYVREDRSDQVTRFVRTPAQSVAVNRLHELEIRNALRLKRFRDEIDDAQLAASLGMIAADFAARRLVRHDVDWGRSTTKPSACRPPRPPRWASARST